MAGHKPPCASCRLLRRRCTKDCPFLPYFPSEDPHKFAIVHKVFGASNIAKMLQDLAVDHRADAVSSLVYEANARIRDPVYGCVGAISHLQNQVAELQMQLAMAQAELLCFQMKQEIHDQHHQRPSPETMVNLPERLDEDDDIYFLQEYLNFDSSSNNVNRDYNYSVIGHDCLIS